MFLEEKIDQLNRKLDGIFARLHEVNSRLEAMGATTAAPGPELIPTANPVPPVIVPGRVTTVPGIAPSLVEQLAKERQQSLTDKIHGELFPKETPLAISANRAYTASDIAAIRDRFKLGQSDKEIGKAIGRTPVAVGAIRSKLGLSRRVKAKNSCSPWTLDKEAELRDLVSRNVRLDYIVTQVGRSEKAVTVKAQRLGLVKGIADFNR